LGGAIAVTLVSAAMASAQASGSVAIRSGAGVVYFR
jgi:hypothetical protein